MRIRAVARCVPMAAGLLAAGCGKSPTPVPSAQPKPVPPAVQTASTPEAQPGAATVRSSTGWLCGTLTNINGAVLDRARLWQYSADTNLSGATEVFVTVDPRGRLVTEALKPGVYTLLLRAPGHVLAKEYDSVEAGATTTVAWTIEPIGANVPAVTGTVLDAETRLPLAGVTLKDTPTRPFYDVTEWTPQTDAAGRFIVRCSNTLVALEFSLPGYLDCQRTIVGSYCTLTNFVVLLSRPAQVNVRAFEADGSPCTDKWVRVSGYGLAVALTGGGAVFSNLPVTAVPCTLFLLDSPMGRRQFAYCEVAHLTSGVPAEVELRIPRYGRLIVRFSERIASNDFGRTVGVSGEHQHPSGDVILRSSFVEQGDDWVCSTMLTGDYRLYVEGELAIKLTTNVLIRSGEDTVLELGAGPGSVGAIEGELDAGRQTPLDFRVDTWQVGSSQAVERLQFEQTSTFRIASLDLRQTYEVHVKVRFGLGVSATNLAACNVRPNGSPLRFILDRMFNITGTVVDRRGDPLEAKILMPRPGQTDDDGSFVCGPFPPGPCILMLKADGCAPVLLDLVVQASDLDVGTIVMDEGVALKGRVVDAQGKPFPDARVTAIKMPLGIPASLMLADQPEQRVGPDGSFVISNMPRGFSGMLVAGDDEFSMCATAQMNELNGDHDAGVLELRPVGHLVLRLETPDGTPAPNIAVMNLVESSAEPGVYQGTQAPMVLFNELWILPGKSDRSEMDMFENMIRIPCSPGTAPTNHMTVRIPEDAWRKLNAR